MIKLLIFANCQGAYYKNIIQKAVLPGRLSVEHIISYENLDNFPKLESKFADCDILVIQPVENYGDFKIDNIQPLLKNTCLVIKIPFLRFDGFWLEHDHRPLAKIDGAAVILFANIAKEEDVDDYLLGSMVDPIEIQEAFQKGLEKLVSLEKKCDVKFVDFFLEYYKKIPLFRDPWHPTRIMFRHLALQVVNIIFFRYANIARRQQPVMEHSWVKEFGHFKPITDRCSEVLQLEYDLDSYFQYSRRDYLITILHYDNTASDRIIDLLQLKDLLNGKLLDIGNTQAMVEVVEAFDACGKAPPMDKGEPTTEPLISLINNVGKRMLKLMFPAKQRE